MDSASSYSARSIVDWGAAFAGGAIATGIALVLLAFGAALGLSVASPYEGEGLSPAAFAIAAGLYLLWVQLMSFGVGGYVAGRLRPRSGEATEHEVDTRDALHGLLVWALGVIAAAAIATASLGGAGAAARAAEARSEIAASISDVADEAIAESAAEEAATNPDAAAAAVDARRAEIARKFTVISAFIAAASLLAGAVAAIFAAGLGGRHRDQNTLVGFFVLRPSAAPKTTPAP
ncbi:MAG: hypothetical protein GC206_03700 [Alphaproteobacteria bacterium]|nr:hypothetical protein [Alphaproteobacteria bacterium]